MFHLISRPFEMLNLYVNALLQYANSDGRSSRSEFCLFFGINLFFFALLSGPVQDFPDELGRGASLQFALALIIPCMALGMRRMHDCGKKGWYFFIPVYNLMLAFSKGESNSNQWGPEPKRVLCSKEI